ncbi:glycosyltransferase family 2 protein [Microbacterium arabinogalactanolyticum]|uniref:glycosyltransferase family 2 protein n=1 Tax=Microbacterium arabinogalactanolyticum TaxID=69365 RepID=UPI002557B8C4|nr:glycosyltransferase family A protein [Microbacterium arabinogalactanolyticum]GLC85359.1 hypothetical protein MIAR_19460 [Microbacterium arabinogalactanolyticum]
MHDADAEPNTAPAVSVIITSYDSGDFLARAVRSVLAQTVDDYEIIVIDDGSRVPQPEIAHLDPRIRFHAQRNRGVSVARNVGVSLARAELIAFLDHDDIWYPTKLERQLRQVTEFPDAAFWCTGFDWVRGDSITPSGMGELDYPAMLRGTTILPSTVMIRRSDYLAIGGHNPLLTHAEDGDLFLRLVMDGARPAVIPDSLVRYELHEANASSDYRSIADTAFDLLRRHGERATRRGDADVLRAVAAGRARARELYSYQAIDAARSAHGVDRLHHFGFALRTSPRVAVHALRKTFQTRLLRLLRRG